MTLHLVGFVVARVALHQSACSWGYAFERGSRSQVSFEEWCVCGCCGCDEVNSIYSYLIALDVVPASSFIASKERAQLHWW
jgi:hypothetical protein